MYDIEGALRRRAMMERLEGLQRADRATAESAGDDHPDADAAGRPPVDGRGYSAGPPGPAPDESARSVEPAPVFPAGHRYLPGYPLDGAPVVDADPTDPPQIYDRPADDRARMTRGNEGTGYDGLAPLRDLTPLHDDLTLRFQGGPEQPAEGPGTDAFPGDRPAAEGPGTPALLSRLLAARPAPMSAPVPGRPASPISPLSPASPINRLLPVPPPAQVAPVSPVVAAEPVEPAAPSGDPSADSDAANSSAAAIADMFRQGGASLFFGMNRANPAEPGQ